MFHKRSSLRMNGSLSQFPYLDLLCCPKTYTMLPELISKCKTVFGYMILRWYQLGLCSLSVSQHRRPLFHWGMLFLRLLFAMAHQRIATVDSIFISFHLLIFKKDILTSYV